MFDLKGSLVGQINLKGAKVGEALRAAGYAKGVYMLRAMEGSKKFMAKVTE